MPRRKSKRHNGKKLSLTQIVDPSAKLHPTVKFHGRIRIYEGVEIGQQSYFGSTCYIGRNVKIGNYCSISRFVEIAPRVHDYTRFTTHPFTYDPEHYDKGEFGHSIKKIPIPPQPVTEIGHDVLIGLRAVINQGVKIGTGAIIGSNAVVTKDVPPYAIVGGVPAKIIGYRFDDTTTIQRLLKSEWWKYDLKVLSKLDFDDIASVLHYFGV